VKEQAVLSFCKELGKALMSIDRTVEDSPVVVMTGGRGDDSAADKQVVCGAREALGAASEKVLARRVVTFPPPGQHTLLEPFAGTHVQFAGGTRQARRFAMTLAADVVVMVNGGHGTSEQATLCMALNRLCVPLPFTGGQARELWKSRDGEALQERFAPPAAVRNQWEAMTQLPTDHGQLAALAAQVAELVVTKAERPCFVSMPYQPHAKQNYEDIIRPAIQDAGMRPVRSDHGLEAGSVTEEMRTELKNAAVVCALLTDVRYARSADDSESVPSVNPNVMYEIGYAHALGKPTFLLAENADGIPFNVVVDRVLLIGRSDSASIRSQLTGMLRNARHKCDAAEADSG
jgi:predicted Rossmann-fold nucleotide-binding protein